MLFPQEVLLGLCLLGLSVSFAVLGPIAISLLRKHSRAGALMEDPLPESICEKGSFGTRETWSSRKALGATTGNVQINTLDRPRSNGISKTTTTTRADRKRARRAGSRAAVAAGLEGRREPCPAAVVESATGDFDGPFGLYEAYRAGQCKNTGTGRQGKWPDELEDAFIDALEVVGDLGKKKEYIEDEYFGVNELIGYYVYMIAGTDRYRKQISSHKQVVRQKLPFTTDWTSRLIAWKREKSGSRRDDARVHERRGRLWAFIKEKSKQRALEPVPSRRPTKKLLKRAARLLRRSQSPATAMATAQMHEQVVWPVRFAMWAMCMGLESGRSIDDSTHIYTELDRSQWPAPLPLESIPDWRTLFPYVSSLRHDGAVACFITLLDTSLNLTVPSSPLAKLEHVTETQLEVLASPAYRDHVWECTTSIYCFGNCVWSEIKTVPELSVAGSFGDGDHDDDDHVRPVHVKLPFASEFWDQMLAQLSAETLHGSGLDAEGRAGQHVRNMSAVLEVRCAPRSSSSSAAAAGDQAVPGVTTMNRAALFLWRFSETSTPGEAGRTTHRLLIPPASSILNTASSPSPAPAAAAAAAAPPTSTASQEPLTQLWNDEGCSRSTETLAFHDEAYGSQPTLEAAAAAAAGGADALNCLPVDLMTSTFYFPFESDVPGVTATATATAADADADADADDIVHHASSSALSTQHIIYPASSSTALHVPSAELGPSYLSTGAANDEPYGGGGGASVWHSYVPGMIGGVGGGSDGGVDGVGGGVGVGGGGGSSMFAQSVVGVGVDVAGGVSSFVDVACTPCTTATDADVDADVDAEADKENEMLNRFFQ